MVMNLIAVSLQQPITEDTSKSAVFIFMFLDSFLKTAQTVRGNAHTHTRAKSQLMLEICSYMHTDGHSKL